MTYKEAEELLEVYSLEEILELNDLTEEDILCFLMEHSLVKLPEVRPL